MNSILKKLLILPFVFIFLVSFAQEKRYKAVQGLGYLHTQVSLLINNWDVHPLNHAAIDEHEEIFQKHLVEELEHDEEWAEYMMVEENLVFAEGGIILDLDVQEALDDNLEFYHMVIKALRSPDTFDLDEYEVELELADERLYELIFPALIR